MRSKDELLNKLSGYHSLPRGIYLLLKDNVLTKPEFILYLASLSFADWDKKHHPQKYGSFDLTQSEIESLLNFSPGYVSRTGGELIKKGFWKKRADERIQVSAFELTDAGLLSQVTKKNKIVNVQNYLFSLQTGVAKSQNPVANAQILPAKAEEVFQPHEIAKLQTPSPISDLVSSKNEFNISSNLSPVSLISVTVTPIRTDEEYDNIIKENGYTALTVDDLKWIDTNVKEINPQP